MTILKYCMLVLVGLVLAAICVAGYGYLMLCTPGIAHGIC